MGEKQGIKGTPEKSFMIKKESTRIITYEE